MSRRPSNSSRRAGGTGLFGGLFHPKSRISPLVSGLLIIVGLVLLVGHFRGGSGVLGGKGAVSHVEVLQKNSEKDLTIPDFVWAAPIKDPNTVVNLNKQRARDFSCTLEVQNAIPALKKAYGDNMRKVLHVGPDTCSVVTKLMREQETEAWGVEPYDMEDADRACKTLVRKGLVREADIKYPLPYRAKSFNLVIISDALEYLSPKYLNKTLPDLARVSANGLVIFTGFPGKQRAKVAELSKFGRPAKMRTPSWWMRFFVQTSLEVNEAVANKFDKAATKMSYKPTCQVFHLNSFH